MEEMQTKKSKVSPKNSFTYAVGRRKEASARVRLYAGKGESIVNGEAIEKYFPSPVEKNLYLKPFTLTKTDGTFYATIKVDGSGKSGQLLAVIHGLARALDKVNNQNHTILKKAGLLTRDPRVKERRKYGLAQKARKGKQSPKR